IYFYNISLDGLGLLLDGHRFRQILKKTFDYQRSFFIGCGFAPDLAPHKNRSHKLKFTVSGQNKKLD
nr:hypothetical protein [Acinetobacter sp.]